MFVGPSRSQLPFCLLRPRAPLPSGTPAGDRGQAESSSAPAFQPGLQGSGPRARSAVHVVSRNEASGWVPPSQSLLATEGPSCTLGHPEPLCLPWRGEPKWKFVCEGLRLQTATVPNGLRFSVARARLGDGRGARGARLPTAGSDLRCLRPASEASRTSFPTGALCVLTCSPSGPPAAPPRGWVPPTSRPRLMPAVLPVWSVLPLPLMETARLPNPPREPPGRAQKLPGAPGCMWPCLPLTVHNTSWLPAALPRCWFPADVSHHLGVGWGLEGPPRRPNDGDNRAGTDCSLSSSHSAPDFPCYLSSW